MRLLVQYYDGQQNLLPLVKWIGIFFIFYFNSLTKCYMKGKLKIHHVFLTSKLISATTQILYEPSVETPQP